MEKVCQLRSFLKQLHERHKDHFLSSKIQNNSFPLCPNPRGCNNSDCSEVWVAQDTPIFSDSITKQSQLSNMDLCKQSI
jgi:hypothetical protein